MGSMVQSYLPGGGSRSVTAAPASAGGGNDELMELFRERARRAMQPAPTQAPPRVGGTSGPAPRAVSRSYNDSAGNKTPLDVERERAEMAQLRAVSSPPPMRMVGGAGIVPGYMPDVNAMNGAQRQMYLPQGSENNPDADVAAEARRRALESLSFSDFQRSSNAGQRGTNY